MQMKYVEYDSNNSGGSFWLSEEDWDSLEKAGWYVKRPGYNYDYSKDGNLQFDEEGRLKVKTVNDDKIDWTFFGEVTGALLFNATEEQAIESFEKATGKDAYEEGCSCCGPPHNFHEYEIEVKNKTKRLECK